MNPSVVISARGEQRIAAGHPWIYRADLADVRATPSEADTGLAFGTPALCQHRKSQALFDHLVSADD